MSPGCTHCYALDLAKRWKAAGQPHYQRDGAALTSGPGFGVSIHRDAFEKPLHWRAPRRVFVNSMSDLFHPEVPFEVVDDLVALMAACPQHTFQVLTKRPNRMLAWYRMGGGPVPDNVWMGVSVESQYWAERRVPVLLQLPARVRFLSCEPLLGPLDLTPWLWRRCPRCAPECPTSRGIGSVAPWGGGDGGAACECQYHGWVGHETTGGLSWVIVGGESGRVRRPMEQAWPRALRDQCEAASVPFFFKQWGGLTPKAGGRELDGRTWDEFPA